MSTGGELNCKWGISSGDSPPQVCILFCSKSTSRSIWCSLEFGYNRIYWRQSQCMKWCGERIGWLEKNWIWIEGLRGSTSASGIQKYSNNSLLWFISFYTSIITSKCALYGMGPFLSVPNLLPSFRISGFQYWGYSTNNDNFLSSQKP